MQSVITHPKRSEGQRLRAARANCTVLLCLIYLRKSLNIASSFRIGALIDPKP